jgi:hypothetical protein
MQQTFPVNEKPRILIEAVNGDLSVSPWDSRSVNVSTEGHIDRLYQEGEAVVIQGCDDDLLLQVPNDAEINVRNTDGDVLIKQVRRVELHDIQGDVVLDRIGEGVDIELIGEAIAITHIAGDLVVRDTSSLRVRENVEGDASISNVALLEVERIDGDMSLQHPETVVIGAIGGDLSATGIEDALTCGSVGGDCVVNGSGKGECTLGNVGGDLSVNGMAKVHIGSAGGDCVVRDAANGLEVGNIGGEASFHNIGTSLNLGNIGGDASLKAIQGAIEAGNIGGDLSLEATFPAGSVTRLHVGSDALVQIPTPADLAISAYAGGDISGISASWHGGNQVSVVYGSGAARLELYVGGDLTIRGGGQPGSSSYSGPGNWGNRGKWQSEFERDMAELGREMGRLGQEISREITDAFKEAGWQKGSKWSNEFADKMEEQLRRARRKAEEQRRKAEEHRRKAEEHAARVRVRFNEREWQFDPERLERLKEQAARAANEGITGALEAVERALENLRVPPPPRPPMPPAPPTPPPPPGWSPVVPPSPAPGQPPSSMAQNTPQPPPSDQRTAPEQPGESEEPNIEQEREAILRMIAEGRISPEEGDMLLEGLGG